MLTQESLLKSHYYNPTTGLLYVRQSSGKLKLTGTADKLGRLLVTIKYTTYKVHRVAWLYMTGEWPSELIDHVDGNPSNNKWKNLRLGDKRGNSENQKKAQISNISAGLLGVSAKRNKFRARIRVEGKDIALGTFDTPEEAHEAYIKAKRELHLFNTL